jgi:hypothetical protein
VDARMGRGVGLDAAVIDAAVFLLRFLLRLSLRLRPSVSLLLMLLRGLLMLLLRGLRLLMLLHRLLVLLLRRLRFAVLLTLLPALCEARDSGSEKQEQNCCADKASSFHLSVLLLSEGPC